MPWHTFLPPSSTATSAASLCVAVALASAITRCTGQEYIGQEGTPATRARPTDEALIAAWGFLGLFCMASFATVVAGCVVALQWPRPHFLCYRTQRSDLPSGRGCCSLYRMNLGYGSMWLVFFVVMIVARSVSRTIVCLSFAALHWSAVMLFQQRFRKFGYPGWQDVPPITVSMVGVAGARHRGSDRQLAPRQQQAPQRQQEPAIGIPVYAHYNTVYNTAPALYDGSTPADAASASSPHPGMVCYPPPGAYPFPNPHYAQQPPGGQGGSPAGGAGHHQLGALTLNAPTYVTAQSAHPQQAAAGGFQPNAATPSPAAAAAVEQHSPASQHPPPS